MDNEKKKLEAIELLATGGHTYEEICKLAKVSNTTLRSWRNNREFADMVIARARELIREAMPDMYKSAVKHAKEGNHSFFKILIEHVDRLEELSHNTREKSISFTWKK